MKDAVVVLVGVYVYCCVSGAVFALLKYRYHSTDPFDQDFENLLMGGTSAFWPLLLLVIPIRLGYLWMIKQLKQGEKVDA